MASNTNSFSLPPPSPNQNRVTVSPITGGYLTIPDSIFVTPANPDKTRYVPSLAFLITHPGLTASSGSDFIKPSTKPIRILFDLGLRQDVLGYKDIQQRHLQTRKPFELFPGVPERLRKGGIDPKEDIDGVILSHVHYDHHGDPEEFTKAEFFLGSGSLQVLEKGLPAGLGNHQHFTPNLLPKERTREFPVPGAEENVWKALGPFPHALDLIGDGSIFVIDTPGHLPGHINLLCRIDGGESGIEEKWVCLCGDTFHDPRLLSGEKEIGTWEGEGGRICCIHIDIEKARESIKRLRILKGNGNVELIAAHDDEWAKQNEDRFFPRHL